MWQVISTDFSNNELRGDHSITAIKRPSRVQMIHHHHTLLCHPWVIQATICADLRRYCLLNVKSICFILKCSVYLRMHNVHAQYTEHNTGYAFGSLGINTYFWGQDEVAFQRHGSGLGSCPVIKALRKNGHQTRSSWGWPFLSNLWTYSESASGAHLQTQIL